MTGAAEDLVDPVVGGHTLVEVHILVHAITGAVETGDIVLEERILVLGAHEIVCVLGNECVLVCHLLYAGIGVEVDGNFAFLTALGGDDYNTVCTAATVDSGGEGVLQHVDALDVGGRDVGDALHGESVNDVEG